MFKAKLSVVRGGRKGQEFPLEDGVGAVLVGGDDQDGLDVGPLADLPHLLGHEATATVVEIGEEVTTVAPGDHVVCAVTGEDEDGHIVGQGITNSRSSYEVACAVALEEARLGAALGWHGALSADVIIGPDGPRFIDINPRLVELVNALASGVDLAGALVEVARSGSSRVPQPAAAPGARTHQLLLAVLGLAGWRLGSPQRHPGCRHVRAPRVAACSISSSATGAG